ncbi:MAG: sulfotransferase family 2 domain-containing protein, partial [Flavobacteriaceae bacterium]|nr:sulfotransferase family 2 domain-containing protein [Flavobacteriaceae bacterium]
CHYEKALSYIDKAISLLIDNPNREVVFSLRKIDILQTLGKEDDIKILLLSLANSYPEDERIKFKRKVLKEQTNTEVLDKVKVEEKILMQLREDENYFSKIVSLLNTLADGWARNDLLGRMVVILKSKQDVDSLMVKDTEKKQLIKTIYILWLQGFDNAPTLVKKCLESWVQKNPTWDIILLDESSLKKYINIDTYLDSKTISKASLSDIIRISLLNKYGGLWVDATTYCSRPLDDWLGRYIINGFFAFNFEKHLDIIPDRPIASWFLYGEKDNYIINQWYEKAMEYCQKTVMIGLNPPSSTKERWIRKETEEHYFWFHYLFDDLCKLNVTFKNLWENIPKSSEKGPHFIQNNGMLEVLSENVRMHIDLKKSPLYKLSYRYDKKKYNEQCNLYYLLNPQYTTMSIAATSYKVKDPLPYLHFVHIGKCGGTALMMAFKDQEIKLSDFHLKKPKVYNSDEKYIIWIRNPLHRFVSAFNFSLALIKLDTSTLDSNNLTIYNCLAPGRIRYKMRSNHTFSDEYDDLIEFFQTANNLAEALSNKDNTIKNKSLKLMRFPAEHINRGIGWYLDNGNFVKENNEKILFVGKVETMKTDMANLSKVLDISLKSSSKKIRENILYNKDLSELAVKNILDFYKSTDYKALEELHRLGWIDNNTYQSYYKY